MDDVHPRLVEVVEDMVSKHPSLSNAEQMRDGLEMQLGIDFAEVDDEDAEKFADAYDDGDWDTALEVLEDNGVPEDVIEQNREILADMGGNDDGGDDPRGNGETPPSGAGGGGDTPTRSEVQSMIAQEVPDASEIAQQLQSQVASGGGGGGGGGGQQGQGAQLGQLVSLAQLAMGGGGGASALGEKVQEAALESFMRDLQKPSLGDMLEARYYEEALGSDVVDEMYGDLMPDDDPAADAVGFGSDGSDGDDDGEEDSDSLVIGE